MLSELTKAQLQAVKATEGPVMILAGAGTGKTRTITAKIWYLIKEKQVDPASILALTFTREAAASMRRKVEDALGTATEVKLGTFHAFCAEVIKDNSELFGIRHNFDIMEEMDVAVLLFRELGLDPWKATRFANTIIKAKDLNLNLEQFEEYVAKLKENVLNFHPEEEWKNQVIESEVRLRTLHTLEAETKEQKATIRKEKKELKDFIEAHEDFETYNSLVEAWNHYEKRKAELNRLDYADLNRILLDKYHLVSEKLESTFKYIIVDEFQDTNYVQFELIKRLGQSGNITVVGDMNQSIYAFRGAYTDNIEHFSRVFGVTDKDIIHLDTSFRSSNKILRTAHNLIIKNYPEEKKHICKPIFAKDKREGENVRVIRTADPQEEARRITDEIQKLLENGVDPSEIAVLYRSHRMAAPIQKALERRGIAYRLVKSGALFERPEIKTAMAYLYVLNNYSSPTARADESWWKILRQNYDFDAKDAYRIGKYLKDNKETCLHELLYSEELEKLGLSEKSLKKIETVKGIIDALYSKLGHSLPDLVLDVFDKSGLSRQFSKHTLENKEALLNLRDFHAIVSNYDELHGKDLPNLIAYLEILDEIERSPLTQGLYEKNSVKLMTLHAAKGLEFEAVLIPEWVKDSFPLYRGGVEPLIPQELDEQLKDIKREDFSSDSKFEKAVKERKKEIKRDEERRLGYVGLTRAKNHLFLTLPQKKNEKDLLPSEFLVELGCNLALLSEEEKEKDIGDLSIELDEELLAKEITPETPLELIKSKKRQLLLQSLDNTDPLESVRLTLLYHALSNRNVSIDDIAKSWKQIDPTVDVSEILERIGTGKLSGITFDPEKNTLSYSSFKTYLDCPLQFELAHILRMPERKQEGGALGFGSFIHETLEQAMKEKLKTKAAILELLEMRAEKEGLENLGRAKQIVEVFWERNSERLGNIDAIEKPFRFSLGGFTFTGKIDRIDNLPGGGVEIIDYKTGKEPQKRDRNLQLLFYTLAARDMKKDVKKVTLELLENDVPRSFEVKEGEFVAIGSRADGCNIEETTKFIVEKAKEIAKSYETGFEPTEGDGCKWCGYKLYCDKQNQ